MSLAWLLSAPRVSHPPGSHATWQLGGVPGDCTHVQGFLSLDLNPTLIILFGQRNRKGHQIQRDGKEISLFDGGAGKQITKDEDCRGRGTVIIFVIYCNYYPLST